MTLSIELLKSMSPQHAINALRADFDPLTATALEAFLLDWVERLEDAAADSEPIDSAAAEYDLEPEDIRAFGDALIGTAKDSVALLGALGEAGIDSLGALKAELDLATQFRSLAADAGDVFPRLTNLALSTQ
jgi:hypothetical protein